MSAEEKKNPVVPAGPDDDFISQGPRLDIPEGEQPDLLDYLASLPDVEEDPSMEEEKAEEPGSTEDDGKTEEEKRIEVLAALIRSRSGAAQITPLALLCSEDEGFVEVLENLSKDEAYKDIVCIKGAEDSYYYSNKIMSDSFANIAVLVNEKNDVRTLAHSVRERSSYPALTYAEFFHGYPFNFSADQMEQIRETIKTDPAYEDIQVFKYQNAEFFYSLRFIKHEIALCYADELVNAKP